MRFSESTHQQCSSLFFSCISIFPKSISGRVQLGLHPKLFIPFASSSLPSYLKHFVPLPPLPKSPKGYFTGYSIPSGFNFHKYIHNNPLLSLPVPISNLAPILAYATYIQAIPNRMYVTCSLSSQVIPFF